MFVKDRRCCDSYTFLSHGTGQFTYPDHRVFLFEDNRRTDGDTQHSLTVSSG